MLKHQEGPCSLAFPAFSGAEGAEVNSERTSSPSFSLGLLFPGPFLTLLPSLLTARQPFALPQIRFHRGNAGFADGPSCGLRAEGPLQSRPEPAVSGTGQPLTSPHRGHHHVHSFSGSNLWQCLHFSEKKYILLAKLEGRSLVLLETVSTTVPFVP